MRLTGFRIAARTLLLVANVKATKAADFNGFATGKRIDDLRHCLIDDLFPSTFDRPISSKTASTRSARIIVFLVIAKDCEPRRETRPARHFGCSF